MHTTHDEDTQVCELPFGVEHDDEVTQPIALIPMDEMIASGPALARSYSRDLEVRPDISRADTVEMKPCPRAETQPLPVDLDDEEEAVPDFVRPERARRLTQPFGSRGAGPTIKVG